MHMPHTSPLQSVERLEAVIDFGTTMPDIHVVNDAGPSVVDFSGM
jgi:hypothetical protein